MAPAAKRAAKGHKWDRDPQLGDLVLAKVKGYPFWPAKVSRPEDWNHEPAPRKFFVLFFGTKEIAFVALQDLLPFTEEVKSDFVNQAREKRFPKRHAKGLEEALLEICKAYDELPKSSETANGVLPDRALHVIEKPTDPLVKPPDDGEAPRPEQMEVNSSMDNLNALGHGSGTEEDVKGGVHDRKDLFSKASKRKKPVEKDPDHSRKKKPVTSKSAMDKYLEQARSPTSPCLERETEDQKVGKEGHPTEGLFLDPTVEIVCALEAPKKNKSVTQLKNADREENKRVDVTGISGRTTVALPDTVPNNSADKESKGKKLKSMMKQSLTEKTERRGPNKVIFDKPNKQLTGKSPAVFNSNKKSLPGNGQRKPEGSTDMRPAKRPKLVDRANETVKTGAKSELKLPVDNEKDNSVKNEKSTSAGAGKNTCPETVTTDGSTRKSGVVVSPPSRPHSERLEQAPGSAKRSKLVDRANETVKTGAKSELKLPVDNEKDNSVKNEKSPSMGAGNNTFPETVTTDGSTRKSGAVVLPPPRPHSERLEQAPGSAKRSKLVDRENETVKTGAKSELKLPVDNEKDNSVKNEKSTSMGAGNNAFPETVTTDGSTRKSGVVVSPLPRPHSERLEQAPGSATKLSGVDTAKKGSSMKNDGSRVGRPLAQPRRRACRFDDDDEEEKRTPPHKTVAKSVSTHVTPTDKIHQTGIRGIPSSQVGNVSAKKSGVAREEKPRSVGRSPVKHEPIYSPSQDKVHARPQMMGRKSATISVDSLGNKINSADRKSSGQLRTPASSEVKKPQGSSSKVLYQTSGNSHSQGHAALEKNVLISKSENAKAKAKPSTQIAMTVENRSSATLPGERIGKLDHSKDDRSNSVDKADFAEPDADSVKSMKHLIAAAQARRNHLASGQGNSDGSSTDNAVLASAPYGLPGLSPSPVLHIQSASRNAISEGDILQSQDCEPGQRVDVKKPAETDHKHVKSPKPKQSIGSLGGGTDAAIARDALEGMIKTLSRTKDSIGRATRHAIECSKHGIAEEIVELLIRKIENEPNLHRKIDLLFLLDSITQCSHSQKGVAGASYVPSVQAALPRLLSAAAPPVSGARENRRQCLKVLRLWLERKIMPENVLRKYMNDIEVRNDNTNTGFLQRRPSRAERSVDDPIREMDDMLVDEYGSNTTFELSGILSSNVFENDEDFPRINGLLPVISLLVGRGGIQESEEIIAPNSVGILESVTSDAVMEDVLVLPRSRQQIDGAVLIEHDSRQEAGSKEALTNQYELPPLPEGPPPLPLDSPPPQPLPDGSPPLPLDSPPSSPPLPPSPPPATPPQPPPQHSPSSPPPLPPLPSGPPPQPAPPPPQPAPPPTQPAPPPPLPSIPPPVLSSPSSLGYQHAVPEYFRPSNGNQLTGNSSIQGIGNTANFMPAGPVNAQAPVNFAPSLPPDYGSNNIFLPQQASNGNYQFQPGVSFHQGAFSAFPSAQTPPIHPNTHHTHMNPMGQQSVPPPCNSYGVQSFPNSQSQYTSEEQWRMTSGNFSPDDQHNTWLPGGRSLSCSDGSFMQDGYPRSNIDRSSMNPMSHQHPVLNHLPSGAPHPGHVVPHMLPAKPDIHSLNCWRPSG